MAAEISTPPPRRRFSFTPPVSPTKPDAVYSVGAPKQEGKMPFIIGVAGGTASGKTSVCRKIMEALGQNSLSSNERRVVIVNQDCFYRDLDVHQREIAAKGEYNFDHPDAFDNELMKHSVHDLLLGKQVDLPVYDFKTHTRSKTDKKRVYQADVILLEGILVLYNSDIRDMMAVKLFVDTDSDTRLARRVQRDIQERGRTLESVLEQYTKYVKPAFEEFTLPTKKYADVIIPRGAENDVAINLIVQHIKNILECKIKMPSATRTTPTRTKSHSESSCSSRPH